MPRGNRSTSRSAPKEDVGAVSLLTTPPEEPKEEPKEQQEEEVKLSWGYFDLVVETFQGPLPGSDGYDSAKDRMLIGAQYGNTTVPTFWKGQGDIKDVTPYEFLTDPKTGLRQGQFIAPHGTGFTDLTKGISSWTDLPPIYIWNQGQWLSDAVWDVKFDLDELTTSWVKPKVEKAMADWPKQGVPEDLFCFWVVSGEGTTGNNLYRLYELPKEVATLGKPKHPRMWKKELQEKKNYTAKAYGSGYGSYGSGSGTGSTTTTKAASIPAGVRYRCPGCGHWYNQSDLPGHAQVCGKGEDADWAMMCHTDCGCTTLDEACKPKAGFPRPKPEPKVEEKAEEEVAVEATVTT